MKTTPLSSILGWTEYATQHELTPNDCENMENAYSVRPEVNEKVSIWKGETRELLVDAVLDKSGCSIRTTSGKWKMVPLVLAEGELVSTTRMLRIWYLKTLAELPNKSVKSIAISHNPLALRSEQSAHVLLYSVRQFLSDHAEHLEKVIICVSSDNDMKLYEDFMHRYFPLKESYRLDSSSVVTQRFSKPRNDENVCSLVINSRLASPSSLNL